MSQQAQPLPSLSLEPVPPPKPSNVRWMVCGLLFFATTINYVDRSILNALEPTLKAAIQWNDFQYGLIGAGFSLAYAIGFLLMGRLIELAGVRIGYAIAVGLWTCAAASTIIAGFVDVGIAWLVFGAARFMLGLFEAGNFPAAIKTVAEWFPQRQRASATGIFNAGSNVGAVIAPIIAVVLVPMWGWRAAFLATPLLATLWIIAWVLFYHSPADHPRANQAERELIASDSPPTTNVTPVRWRFLLPHRQAWAFMTVKFLTDPIWWFYLFWSGKFFAEQFNVKLEGLAGPLILVYILADVGSVGGGWLSSMLLRRGWTPNAARKTAMGLCVALILPVILVPLIPRDWGSGACNIGMWIAATLIGTAAAAHQGFSANVFTLASDMFPKRSISSVVALGGMAGALGSMIMQSASGVIKAVTGSWTIMFIIAGTVYVAGFLMLHLLAPRIERVTEETMESKVLPVPAVGALFAVLGGFLGVPLSYILQRHDFLFTSNFINYLAAIMKGWLFTIPEYVSRGKITEAAANALRSSILRPLAYTPLESAVIMAILGMAIYALLQRSSSKRF